ncbi:MAG TPA: TIGR04282 family arsenosugar biosynthesis glycosyltransferase [Pyrinomonadaceae bacterium]|nr:TIGR04282 family arsenosugar biosynthesis glycosyltransferase [Pyrinomonadaceae bacterium]
MSTPAIIVMAKAPRAGEAKTRLAPPLTPEGAARLAACLFADTVSSALGAGAAVVVAYAPADGRAALEEALRLTLTEEAAGGLHWLEQCGGDLGERLEGVAGRAFEEGFGPLLFVGADSPTLPPSCLAAALEMFRRGRADVALGPTEDGGYYAVGMQEPAAGLFDSVEWSTPRAYDQTARNADRLGLRVLELPPWYDVDTPADLERLRAELSTDEAARRLAPATCEWLRIFLPLV